MDAGTELGNVITARSDELAEALAQRYHAENPELVARDGALGRKKNLRDAQYHIAYLAEAALYDQPGMWSRHLEWTRTMLSARQLPAHELELNLDCLRRVLEEKLSASDFAAVSKLMNISPASAERDWLGAPTCYIEPSQPLEQLATAYFDAMLAGDRDAASQLIRAAIAEGVAVSDIYIYVFQRSQSEIGRRWQLDQVTVAQEHACSAITQAIMSQLYDVNHATVRVGRSMIAAGVGGDLHEIGIRMVSDFFEMEGWDAYYLGANTPTEAIVDAVRDRRPDVVTLSVTMPYHVSEASRDIAALRSAGLARVPQILVGGAAFVGTDRLWSEIGADGTANSAWEVVNVATQLVNRAV